MSAGSPAGSVHSLRMSPIPSPQPALPTVVKSVKAHHLGEQPAVLTTKIGQIIKMRKRRVKTEVVPPSAEGRIITSPIRGEISEILRHR